MKKRKLVFFSALPPYRGGIAQFSQRLLKELETSFNLVAFTFKSQYPRWLFPGKTQLVTNPSISTDYERIVSTFNPFTYFSSLRKIKNENPEIFVVNYWMTFMSPMYVFWVKRLPKDTLKVAVVHNFIPHESRFFDRLFNKRFVNNFDLFIALSSQVENDILAVNPKAKVLHLPHPSYDHFEDPVDAVSARKILKIHEDKQTLLFFGIIRDYKGLDILIRAFSLLPSSFQLVIAGEVYGSANEYKLLIQQSKNQNIFFFNEFILDEQVHIYFSSADLCVLPYRSGTQSGVKAIADRMSIPCLVSKVGGIAEKINDFKDGFVLKELNPIGLKNKIMRIFEGNTLFEVKENIVLKNKSEEFSWGIFTENMVVRMKETCRFQVNEH
ncbi:MAG: glycosyltransferase [Bacteroidetes bacterium]|nr:glycosyltransferase [Bacteroidota bacterium]